jgi:hypothetical protein
VHRRRRRAVGPRGRARRIALARAGRRSDWTGARLVRAAGDGRTPLPARARLHAVARTLCRRSLAARPGATGSAGASAASAAARVRSARPGHASRAHPGRPTRPRPAAAATGRSTAGSRRRSSAPAGATRCATAPRATSAPVPHQRQPHDVTRVRQLNGIRDCRAQLDAHQQRRRADLQEAAARIVRKRQDQRICRVPLRARHRGIGLGRSSIDHRLQGQGVGIPRRSRKSQRDQDGAGSTRFRLGTGEARQHEHAEHREPCPRQRRTPDRPRMPVHRGSFPAPPMMPMRFYLQGIARRDARPSLREFAEFRKDRAAPPSRLTLDSRNWNAPQRCRSPTVRGTAREWTSLAAHGSGAGARRRVAGGHARPEGLRDHRGDRPQRRLEPVSPAGC